MREKIIILSDLVAKTTFQWYQSDLEDPADRFRCNFNHFRPEINYFCCVLIFPVFRISNRVHFVRAQSKQHARRKLGSRAGYCTVHVRDTLVHKFGSTVVVPALRYLSYICTCLLYTSPSPRDGLLSRMPSSA